MNAGRVSPETDDSNNIINDADKYQADGLPPIMGIYTNQDLGKRLRKKITIIIARHTNQNTRSVRMCTTRTAYTSRFIVDEFTFFLNLSKTAEEARRVY
jgi:hypothetical protein